MALESPQSPLFCSQVSQVSRPTKLLGPRSLCPNLPGKTSPRGGLRTYQDLNYNTPPANMCFVKC